MNSRHDRKDAGHTVFGWEEEPSEERPSEWAQSTLAGPASGFHRGGAVHHNRVQPRKSGLGWIGVLVFLVIVGIGVWGALHFLVPMLRR